MMIDKVHGLRSTSISLNDRFTMLATAESISDLPPRQSYTDVMANAHNKRIMDLIARRLALTTRRQAQVMIGSRMRYLSEGSAVSPPNKFSGGNLSERLGLRSQFWRGSTSNMRSQSMSSGSGTRVRSWRWRGRGGRGHRGTNWNGTGPSQQRNNRTEPTWNRGQQSYFNSGGRGRSQRGLNRNPKQLPTRQELDRELDQYMSCSRSVLDKQLDDYVKQVIEFD